MNNLKEPVRYITTKEECQGYIKKHGRVCSGCGGPLTAIETVDNSDNPTHWAGCEECSKFDSGVSPLVFKIAEHMVKSEHYVKYNHLGVNPPSNPAELKYWLSSQISGTTGVVLQVLINHSKFTKI